MALSFAFALRASQLASTSPIARTPGIAMFAAGLLAGTLVVALTPWLRRHLRARRHGSVRRRALARRLGWHKLAPYGKPHNPPEMPRPVSAVPVSALRTRPALRRPAVRPHPARQLRPAQPASREDTSDVAATLFPPGNGTAPSLRIGVLGPLTVNDQAGALVPAQSQLIVALALNRGGLGNGELRRLLGPGADHAKPADSLRQLIARTRRALGGAPGNREWIEHLGHGHYALHPEVWLDLREFDTLAEAGIDRNEAPPLADARGLVRGQPFTGC
ncbi:MAG: hypothetical protein LBV34_09980, partial [Nocardiopsaceae bacterium]|nr:hypothetical protein [Nocardiopsaceae bacterium]